MKITPKKIFHFLEGNLKMFGDYLHILKKHEREQVLYRAGVCQEDCVQHGYCKYCGCSVPGKFYVTESCNSGERFPDLMSEKDWEKFKVENNIEIREDASK